MYAAKTLNPAATNFSAQATHLVPVISLLLALFVASTKVSSLGALGYTFPSANCSLNSLISFSIISIFDSKDWVAVLPGEEGSYG